MIPNISFVWYSWIFLAFHCTKSMFLYLSSSVLPYSSCNISCQFSSNFHSTCLSLLVFSGAASIHATVQHISYIQNSWGKCQDRRHRQQRHVFGVPWLCQQSGSVCCGTSSISWVRGMRTIAEWCNAVWNLQLRHVHRRNSKSANGGAGGAAATSETFTFVAIHVRCVNAPFDGSPSSFWSCFWIRPKISYTDIKTIFWHKFHCWTLLSSADTQRDAILCIRVCMWSTTVLRNNVVELFESVQFRVFRKTTTFCGFFLFVNWPCYNNWQTIGWASFQFWFSVLKSCAVVHCLIWWQKSKLTIIKRHKEIELTIAPRSGRMVVVRVQLWISGSEFDVESEFRVGLGQSGRRPDLRGLLIWPVWVWYS